MLDQCVFCYNCNFTCPVDANPAALMLERLRDRRDREESVPASLQYMINGMESQGWTNNLFRDFYSDHNKDEAEILAKWAEPKDCGDGDLLWCSCAGRVFPYDIEQSHALSGLQKFGGKSDCCGLPAFRSGLFDAGRYLTNNLIERLSQCRFKRLVVMCGSCQDMFQLALPEYYGQEFPFEVISVYQYLDEQIANGNLKIQRRVPVEEKNNTSIFHSCFGYKFGSEYLACIDRLYRAAGYDCMELEHNMENNACCGMGGFYRKGNLWDILDVKGVKKKDVQKNDTEHILAYCYGCYLTSHLFQGGTTHFLLEKVLWALGDEINYPMNGIVGRSFNFSSFKHMMAITPSAIF
jgi:Fe-S oxidoreductase